MDGSDDNKSPGEQGPEFKQRLLTDVDKWWEFLDPETYEVKNDLPQPTRTSSDMLDWSKTRETKRRGRVGFGFFNRCDDCGQSVPPDFTFCVHCGGVPFSPAQVDVYTIIISDIRDGDARDEAAEMILTAGTSDLSAEEVSSMVDQLPVVFNTHARRDQIAAAVQKMAERGIYAKSFSVSDPSVPWLSETMESIFRSPQHLALFAAVIGLTILLAWWLSAILVVGGLAALGALVWKRLQWYRDRYTLGIRSLLLFVSGFDEHTAENARLLLKRMSDDEAREHLTICLMEYYALLQQLRAHDPDYGLVLHRSRRVLEDLLRHVLRACEKYDELHRYIQRTEPAAIRARLAELEDDIASAPDETTRNLLEQERSHLQMQHDEYDVLVELRSDFRRRLEALTTTMESLRARVSSVTAARSASWEEIPLEPILRELDEELGVFEKTFEELEVPAR